MDLFHVLYCSASMCVGVMVWFGWGGVVSLCRLKHCFSLHGTDSTRHNGKGHTPTGKHWHNLITNACSHITYKSVHVMVHSLTLARIDIIPEDGPTVTETCRRFYEILAF